MEHLLHQLSTRVVLYPVIFVPPYHIFSLCSFVSPIFSSLLFISFHSITSSLLVTLLHHIICFFVHFYFFLPHYYFFLPHYYFFFPPTILNISSCLAPTFVSTFLFILSNSNFLYPQDCKDQVLLSNLIDYTHQTVL